MFIFTFFVVLKRVVFCIQSNWIIFKQIYLSQNGTYRYYHPRSKWTWYNTLPRTRASPSDALQCYTQDSSFGCGLTSLQRIQSAYSKPCQQCVDNIKFWKEYRFSENCLNCAGSSVKTIQKERGSLPNDL